MYSVTSFTSCSSDICVVYIYIYIATVLTYQIKPEIQRTVI
jgi:hypothetical protein